MNANILDFISTFKPTEFQSVAPQRPYRAAMTTWNDRLRLAFNEKRLATGNKFTARALSDASDVPYTSVTKYLKGNTEQPRGERVARLAEALEKTEHWIRYGDQMGSYVVRLQGWVGAAEHWHPLDEESNEYIEITFGDDDVFALHVRGTSMAPVYNPGDIIICSKKSGDDIKNAVGKDCVVQTLEGELLVKRLLKESKSHTFRLRSYNPSVDDREGVTLQWAAPVIFIKRG